MSQLQDFTETGAVRTLRRKMAEALIINEIYLSLQGESTFAGLPCIFVRLTACNLRCSYCDTAYAFKEGTRTELPIILDRIIAAMPTGPTERAGL